jgi:ferrous iron transport protein B
LVTILVAPRMSCSARLPVYTLLIGAFVPNLTLSVGQVEIPWLQGLVMFAMYAVGTITGIAAAFVLKRTILRGPTPPFVMELPSYKMPGLRIVLTRMLEQGWAFVYRAGTLIFCVSIVVWGLCYWPHDSSRIAPELLERRAQLLGTPQRAFPTAHRHPASPFPTPLTPTGPSSTSPASATKRAASSV